MVSVFNYFIILHSALPFANLMFTLSPFFKVEESFTVFRGGSRRVMLKPRSSV